MAQCYYLDIVCSTQYAQAMIKIHEIKYFIFIKALLMFPSHESKHNLLY